MNISELLLIAVVTVGFGAALLKALSWPIQASLFPLIVGGVGLVLALIQAMVFFKKKKEFAQPRSLTRPKIDLKIAYTFCWIFGYFLITVIIGFQWGIPAVIFIYLKMSGKEKTYTSLLLSGLSWVTIYGLKIYLNLPLADGFLLKF